MNIRLSRVGNDESGNLPIRRAFRVALPLYPCSLAPWWGRLTESKCETCLPECPR